MTIMIMRHCTKGGTPAIEQQLMITATLYLRAGRQAGRPRPRGRPKMYTN